MSLKKFIWDVSIDTRKSGTDILRCEWGIWLFFSLSTFLAASILMTGWPSGLIPEIRYPYVYKGDGLGVLTLIKRLIEGSWFFNNNRTGFPFGSNFLDYPISDTGSFLILKVLGT